MAQHHDTKVSLHLEPVAVHLRRGGLSALAEERAEQRVTEAYERGFREGLAAGAESGADALGQALSRLEAASERAREALPGHVVELAVEIAGTLLQLRVDAGEYDLERIVRGALADSGVGRGSCVVHLHPDDHARLKDTLFRAGTTLELDPNMVRGDVHLSTPRGLLVRDLDSALETIREQLLEELLR